MAAALLEILDELATPDAHAEAVRLCAGKGWYFGNISHHSDALPFWKMDLDGQPLFQAIWEKARARCEALAGQRLRVLRVYANGHTYGLGGKPHRDDDRPGAFTLLYYPMPEWKEGWEGETVFYDAGGEIALAVRPSPNRAVFFDSRIPHAGRPPGRSCPALRVTVAYKLEAFTVPEEAQKPPEPLPESGFRLEAESCEGAQRTYRAIFPASLLDRISQERMKELGANLRMPGFRPGKIPQPILEQRYGARARADAMTRLLGDAAVLLLRSGSLVSQIETGDIADGGDREAKLTASHLPDLPAVTFDGLTIETLTSPDPAHAAHLERHTRQQVLDFLDRASGVSVAQALTDREFETIWKQSGGQFDSLPVQDRENAIATLRSLAERRVRLGAAITEIARRHHLVLNDEELQAARLPHETPEQTRDRLLENAVIAFLLTKAQITERAASEAELRDFA